MINKIRKNKKFEFKKILVHTSTILVYKICFENIIELYFSFKGWGWDCIRQQENSCHWEWDELSEDAASWRSIFVLDRVDRTGANGLTISALGMNDNRYVTLYNPWSHKSSVTEPINKIKFT